MTKAPTPTEKSNVTTHRRHQNRLHNDCGPTYDGQLGNHSHSTGVVKPVHGIPNFSLAAKAV